MSQVPVLLVKRIHVLVTRLEKHVLGPARPSVCQIAESG